MGHITIQSGTVKVMMRQKVLRGILTLFDRLAVTGLTRMTYVGNFPLRRNCRYDYGPSSPGGSLDKPASETHRSGATKCNRGSRGASGDDLKLRYVS